MGLDVAITGMGVVSALGCSPEQLVDRLIADDLGIRRTPWTVGGSQSPEFWAPVDGFVAPSWMTPKLDGIDPFAQHAGAAATSALSDAGLAELDPVRTGIVLGSAKPVPRPSNGPSSTSIATAAMQPTRR